MNALPQNTQAIVVGVETYDVGSNWNLDGPANDACKFVKWLRARGVPDVQIALFVSALPENQSLVKGLDVVSQQATHAAITKTLTDNLANKSGDLLVFFWGGHGVVDAQNSRRLFCADATEAHPRHISLNNVLTTWRTNTIGHFPCQIGFVDACQNYLEYTRIASTMPEDVLPSGTPRDVEQFFLLAASAGELAANMTREKTGAYSQALLQELEKGSADWPPDMSAINRRLMERFAALREAGDAIQTPSHFWYRDWKGGEGTIASFKQQASAKTAAIQLSNEQRDELVNILLKMDVMSNPAERESVIADLRREIKNSTARSSKAIFDVDNLVKTALKYSGGLKELIHTIKRFESTESEAWKELEIALAKLHLQ